MADTHRPPAHDSAAAHDSTVAHGTAPRTTPGTTAPGGGPGSGLGPSLEIAPSPGRLRRIALDAARAVAPALAEAFRTSGAASEAKTSRHDLVTIHDTATERALIEMLTAAVPDSSALGEETGASSPQGASRVLWIVDPIDGTSNFSHGFAMFSVSIAAEVDGEVVAAVVLDPANGLEFSADDTGAWLGDRPLREIARPRPSTDERHLNVVTSYPAAEAVAHEGTAALDRFGRLVTTYATVRRVVSGALELCHAAAGWADVVLGVDTNPWDVAAAQLILTRAGGRYVPLGGRVDDTAAAPHRAPHYVGLAPGRSAPTVETIARQIVAARR